MRIVDKCRCELLVPSRRLFCEAQFPRHIVIAADQDHLGFVGGEIGMRGQHRFKFGSLRERGKPARTALPAPGVIANTTHENQSAAAECLYCLEELITPIGAQFGEQYCVVPRQGGLTVRLLVNRSSPFRPLFARKATNTTHP
jgi:hypothetical protein